ncbi:hypothetical protein BFO_0364 [Tannerella forsythia 92A2]|uniref:Uncharacterized protein n=1 Tax=Tannerella forsythia (strain ATCC 43037 / JCM 10827 / CCUG 21028 A / KCTC 5666 / FDC 338) TaxID=203275 RepID=G8UK57_TANFA|nr:hypothetical protein BFO_0364 [Tannerella forsythia 92A2]
MSNIKDDFFVLGKKEDVFLRKEINNSTKLYIPPFIVLIFLIRTMLIKGKR